MKLTGAEIVWECLAREGVDVVFGYPGGAILPTYDAHSKYPHVHHVLTRHEQGAAHMADGYARASGKVGVAIGTSGPGATNLVTGIATAMMDSSPVVFITGQVPQHLMGTDAFQETDIIGITLPITKHSVLVREAAEVGPALHEAFHIARTGRPGPVLVDIPKDVQLETADLGPQPAYADEPAVIPDADIVRAHELLRSSERPVILAGHGVLISGAHNELVAFAETLHIPVTQTLLGKGGFPQAHALSLGMMGMHGEAAANHAIQEADLLLALGMRFDDRVTGKLAEYSPHSKKIHIDIDAAEINKLIQVEVGTVADVGDWIRAMAAGLAPADHQPWIDKIKSWQDEDGERDILTHPPDPDSFLAAHAIHELWRSTGGDAISITDVGQHQMWEAQYYPHDRPGTLITSGGMGTMGFALPAAIGAKIARPEEEVWAIVGDGGFQMTMPELATAVQEGVEVKIAIINNGYLGMVRQWQELFHDRRYNATPMFHPDFRRLAGAFGIPACRVTESDEVDVAVRRARAHTGSPFLIEFVVEQHDVVYPMVAAGAALNTMIRRDHKPAQKVES